MATTSKREGGKTIHGLTSRGNINTLSRFERRQEQEFARSLRKENSNSARAQGMALDKHKNTIMVPNLEWVNGEFVNRQPRRAPMIHASIEVMKGAMSRFGQKLDKSRTLSTTTRGLSDTGAQSSSCGPSTLSALGATEEDLLVTSHGITGMTNTRAEILGALLVRVTLGRERNQE